MILLVAVSIWIFKKFKELALYKGVPSNKNKWGALGVVTYIGCAFGFQFLVGILIGLEVIDLDLNKGVEVLIALIGYGIGGLFSYLLYNRYENQEWNKIDIDQFGEQE